MKKTYAQLKTALGLVKGDVGLGNVDNTSDANKPVSTAVQTALNAKATTSSLATIATSGKFADLTDVDTTGAAGDFVAVTQAGAGKATQVGVRKLLPQLSDHVLHVSKRGSDTNDGMSWGSAFLTIGAALAALSGFPGTIEIGAGTYSESFATNGNVTLRGRGRYDTVVQCATNGTLVDLTAVSNSRFEHMGFRFAAGVTGTLLKLSNAFTCDFVDCSFTGDRTAGQIGVAFLANAGDSHFNECYFDSLDVAVDNASTVNYFDGCVFSANATAAIKGGHPTADDAGIVCTNCVFRGTAARYVHITGNSQAWHFDTCWFDSAATTAVEVGTATAGPWLFTMTNCPYLAGVTNSLIINAADEVLLDGIVFGNSGTNPTDIQVNAANAPRGTLGPYKSLQGQAIASLVPATWRGAAADVPPIQTLAIALVASNFGPPQASMSASGIWYTWNFDAAINEGVVGTGFIPKGPTSFTASVSWINRGAGTGNVRWEITAQPYTATGVGATEVVLRVTDAAPTGAGVRSTTLGTVPVTADHAFMHFRLWRLSDDAGDTLPNDAGLIAVTFTPA